MDAESHPHDHQQRGWVRSGGRRGRWLEPFLLLLIAEGETHGYALIAHLNELGVAPGGVDAGMAYRTLRELEGERLVTSGWVADSGAPRRSYGITPEGRMALCEWNTVMRDRARLIGEFLPRFERLDGGEHDDPRDRAPTDT